MSLNKKKENAIKVFGMTNQLVLEELSRIERDHDIELGHTRTSIVSDGEEYYSQFDRSLRNEASSMARHYKIFYCLEVSIRQLIRDTMEGVEGVAWWNGTRVTTHLKGEVEKRIARERESGMTVRSSDPIDFTTFGELSGLITDNWDLFGGVLKNSKAVGRILSNLNSLRGPIAHCCPLAEDEIVRLQLSLRDWFRQME